SLGVSRAATPAKMPSAVMDTLAESSAHGISRVATSRSRVMKVMWFLLFLLFLALFVRSAVTLVIRLRGGGLTKSFELDKVPFVFPDLYFCPNNPYSGSYPHDLSQADAELINTAITNLSAEFDSRLGPTRSIELRARLVQSSLPVHLSYRLLAQRRAQSVLQTTATPTMGPQSSFPIFPRVLPFSHPVSLVCFQLRLTDNDRRKIVAENWQVNLRLSTDPFFAEFNYSGLSVDPIRSPATGEEVPLQDWSISVGRERLQEAGFTMLIVPVGSYPSFAHEAKFQLAPSNSYSVALSMEETEYSEELRGQQCQGDSEAVDFSDHLTGRKLTFAYSPAACYYENLVRLVTQAYGCMVFSFPLTWSLRNTTRCFNMSETGRDQFNVVQTTKTNWSDLDRQVREACRSRQPCRYQRYSAEFSFSRWPSIGSSVVAHFAEMGSSPYSTPATRRLIDMARSLRTRNHSAHTEAQFRAYLSESLINVRIVARSTTSPQVVISPAYSVTAFLADTGGLLGLYVGCSLLTLCEFFELFYRLLSGALLKHRGGARPAEPEAPQGDSQPDAKNDTSEA
ncbi:hypothetical protein BOX15_Mlig031004g1, partial [Macrostomum lignano]